MIHTPRRSRASLFTIGECRQVTMVSVGAVTLMLNGLAGTLFHMLRSVRSWQRTHGGTAHDNAHVRQ